jgi:hypothetical protein
VPIGSSMWVVTFSATFAYLFRSATDKTLQSSCKVLSTGDCCRTVIKLSALSTPLMMVQMTIFQMGSGIDLIVANGGLPPSPPPGARSLVMCLLLYGRTIVRPLALVLSCELTDPYVSACWAVFDSVRGAHRCSRSL